MTHQTLVGSRTFADRPTVRAEEPPRPVPNLKEHGGTGYATYEGPTLVGGASVPMLPALPGYRLLGKLGQGGMGVVYHAWHEALGRDVAVKFLFAAGSDADVARFAQEVRAAGQLNHPGVVRVHHADAYEGRPYLVMEHLTGGTLAKRLTAGPLSPREAAQTVRDVARAMQAVHDAGVVHRDLKPSNILLSADGSPKVADFGLAKLGVGADLTGSVQTMGTPAYMSPEQAAGRAREADRLSDVWALGATLYACLIGRPPFHAPSRAETLTLVLRADPKPPRTLRPDVPKELEAICLKCLERRPRDRFASAGELADELEKWLTGRPIGTPVLGPVAGLLRWLGRRVPPAAASLAVLGFALTAFVAVAAPSPVHPPGAAGLRDELEHAVGEVPLFDGRGRPRVEPRIVVGEDASKVTSYDGAFAVHSSSYCLVQLASDPGRDRFEFRVQVRHHRNIGNTSVGLFLGLTPLKGGPRPAKGYLTLTFTDHLDEGVAWDVFTQGGGPPPPGVPRRPKNGVRLAGVVYAGEGWDDIDLVRAGESNPERFDPSFDRKGAWRTLRVRVSPTEVRSFWGDEVEPASVLKIEDLKAAFRAKGRMLRPDHRAKGVPFEFAPRGAIGLYVQTGVASFRRPAVLPW